ncbi:MAG: GNAT family protein [Nitrososphaeria archaeon]
MVLLKGNKINLRPLEPEDLREVFRMVNSPESVGVFDVFQFASWGEVEKWFKGPIGPNDLTVLLIERNEDKERLGIVVYYSAHPILQNLEIGFQISSIEERSKGYGAEAVRLLVDFLFKTRNVQRVQATTSTENVAAQRVLERNGFIREGLMRKSLFGDGRYQDTYLYSILRDEWVSISSKGY